MNIKIPTVLIIMCLLISSISGTATEINVHDFGAVGDGITDDGRAIQNAFVSLLANPGAKTLVFKQGKQYYIKDIGETYLMAFNDQTDITIEGNGCIFLLDGSVRFINAQKSENITFINK